MFKQPHPISRETAGSAASLPRPYRRRRYGHRETFRRGRLWLLLLFCGLRVSDALTYFANPTGEKSRLLAAIVVAGVWTTVAMCGLWARQDWCRYALSVLVLASTISAAFFMPGLFQLPANYRILACFLAIACVNTLIAWALIALPEIRRLTSRAYR